MAALWTLAGKAGLPLAHGDPGLGGDLPTPPLPATKRRCSRGQTPAGLRGHLAQHRQLEGPAGTGAGKPPPDHLRAPGRLLWPGWAGSGAATGPSRGVRGNFSVPVRATRVPPCGAGCGPLPCISSPGSGASPGADATTLLSPHRAPRCPSVLGLNARNKEILSARLCQRRPSHPTQTTSNSLGLSGPWGWGTVWSETGVKDSGCGHPGHQPHPLPRPHPSASLLGASGSWLVGLGDKAEAVQVEGGGPGCPRCSDAGRKLPGLRVGAGNSGLGFPRGGSVLRTWK